MLTRLLIGFFCLFFLSTTSNADNQRRITKQEAKSIQALTQIMGIRQMDNQMANSISRQIFSELRKHYPSMDQNTQKQVWLTTNRWVNQTLESGPVQQATIELYANYFTPQEVQKMILFYQSPVGKKMLQVTPKILQNLTQIKQKLIVSTVPEFISQMDQEMGKTNSQPATTRPSTPAMPTTPSTPTMPQQQQRVPSIPSQ